MVNFLRYRSIFYVISGTLIGLALAGLFFNGLQMGIEFTGGSIMEVRYEKEGIPDISHIVSEANIQRSTEGLLIRMPEITEETHQLILDELGNPEQLYFELVGPVIGQELTKQVIWAIILSSLIIIIYIAITFSGGSTHSWKYGVMAVMVAFLHDILIIVGLFSWIGWSVTIPVAVALLTILGYSLNDTVVIFDRVRENMLRGKGDLKNIFNDSLNQTIVRSVNTSITTLFVLLAIFFLGGEILKPFILALAAGVIIGTYSSIFLAGPALFDWICSITKKSTKS
jgi:preprotein translocase subunit SecF